MYHTFFSLLVGTFQIIIYQNSSLFTMFDDLIQIADINTDNNKTHNTPSIMRFSKKNQLANVVNLNSTSKIGPCTIKLKCSEIL